MVIKGIKIKETGLKPKEYYDDRIRELVSLLNEEGTALESEVVKDTPANFGRLKGGWTFKPANVDNPVAIVNQSVLYFLPVEMGRRPGKGISAKGQKQVKRWAKLVLGLAPKEQSNFAYLLSQKYKREGRPAVGFLGLAKPGEIPSGSELPENPVKNSLLDKAFNRLKRGLMSL
jgi:hypothetical protein